MYHIYKNFKASSPIIESDVEFVKQQLLQGKVIAFPTDTVYGLACLWNHQDAINKMKKIKGRDSNKPFPMMVSNLQQLEKIAVINQDAKKLLAAFTPGAFTIILDKDESVADYITNGFKTIGVRIPDNQFILNLINALQQPILVTSANKSGYPTGTTLQEVVEQLFDEVDYIVEGECNSKISSTIVDVRNGLKMIREGEISEKQIREVLE